MDIISRAASAPVSIRLRQSGVAAELFQDQFSAIKHALREYEISAHARLVNLALSTIRLEVGFRFPTAATLLLETTSGLYRTPAQLLDVDSKAVWDVVGAEADSLFALISDPLTFTHLTHLAQAIVYGRRGTAPQRLWNLHAKFGVPITVPLLVAKACTALDRSEPAVALRYARNRAELALP